MHKLKHTNLSLRKECWSHSHPKAVNVFMPVLLLLLVLCCRQTLVCNNNFYPVWLYSHGARGASIRTHPKTRNENKIKVAKSEKERRKITHENIKCLSECAVPSAPAVLDGMHIFHGKAYTLTNASACCVWLFVTQNFSRCVCPRSVLHKHK